MFRVLQNSVSFLHWFFGLKQFQIWVDNVEFLLSIAQKYHLLYVCSVHYSVSVLINKGSTQMTAESDQSWRVASPILCTFLLTTVCQSLCGARSRCTMWKQSCLHEALPEIRLKSQRRPVLSEKSSGLENWQLWHGTVTETGLPRSFLNLKAILFWQCVYVWMLCVWGNKEKQELWIVNS